VETKRKCLARYLQDTLVLLVVGGLFYCGNVWQLFYKGSDAARYQCYAVAFWQGWGGLQKLTPGQCTFLVHPEKDLPLVSHDGLLHALRQRRLPAGLIHFVAAQSPERPYHTLPFEYPWLMLLPFSLALLAPVHWYQMAFAIEMLLLIGWIYFVLQHWRSQQAPLACCLYLVVGGLATAVARFDLLPAALTLFAVICAARKRWNWAFACLALATVSKFYAVILVVPFLLALQQATPGKSYAWRKWQPMVLFVEICVLVVGISPLLSVGGTLTPLNYFGNRPVQAESLSASLLWLLGKSSLTYVNTFDALNVVSPLSWNVTWLLTVVLGVGLLSTWWLQWRRRIDLAMACLLTVLLVIITGKIFSPQYLLWVFPLAAYIGQTNRWWLLFWIVVGYLTTWIYPYMYRMVSRVVLAPSLPEFSLVTAVRNFLLLGFILFVLICRSCLSHRLSYDQEQAEDGKQGGENPLRDLVQA
jgi:hypothetical protein